VNSTSPFSSSWRRHYRSLPPTRRISLSPHLPSRCGLQASRRLIVCLQAADLPLFPSGGDCLPAWPAGQSPPHCLPPAADRSLPLFPSDLLQGYWPPQTPPSAPRRLLFLFISVLAGYEVRVKYKWEMERQSQMRLNSK